jgi:hypothetical protein
MARGKIFGIGAARTGTTSLGAALRLLGFAHKSWDERLSRVCYEAGQYEPIFAAAERYESFDDGPWNRGEFYRALDRRFPGSRFVLTVREPASWIASYERFFTRGEEGWRDPEAERARLLQARARREAGVFEYFAQRPGDLLVLDICAGQGWAELCAFLGLPAPALPFPHQNAAASGPRGRLARAARRLRALGAPLARRARTAPRA